MDFYQICTRETKSGTLELFPDFRVGRSKDLMVRGRGFYAIWDEANSVWSQDEYDVQRLVDEELRAYSDEGKAKGITYQIKDMRSFSTNAWSQFRKYMQNISDNSHQLDEHLTFANSEVKKGDFVSRRLPYSLVAGDHSAWDELVGTLYSVEEREKLEWAIGAIVSGDSKKIQKFLVLYGPAGTGKSTILNIIQNLFEGYTTSFEAKALGANGNAFATEAFKNNPLVALQHDGDLSKIEDNTKLNSIISHEEMTMNEKYKPSYTSKVNAFLLMGTNQPVKISDAKSGIIRRLIDVHPTGVKLPAKHYAALMNQIDFELGAIAQHCLETYRSMGKNYYNAYRPLEMMLQTDVFFNYIEASYDVFKEQNSTTLRQAYILYKEFCADTGIDRVLPQYKVREELRNYFDEFKDRTTIDGVVLRSYYSGFNANKFKTASKNDTTFSLVMDETESIFDAEFGTNLAQLASKVDTPKRAWDLVKSTLSKIDTSMVHFVQVPVEHIVIDFDLKDENGVKSAERNLEAASQWPATYAEFSKSGAGVHLHYTYIGDSTQLNPIYSDGIEVKVFTGGSSLRRKLTKCNNVPVADLNGGLPLKEKKMLSENQIKSEAGLRSMVTRNLKKEIHPGTKSSIDFIQKILQDAYDSGMAYDITDMRGPITAFANNSSNQAMVSLKTVQRMRFQGSDILKPSAKGPDDWEAEHVAPQAKDERIVFYDVEVYPNLFVVCWKYQGSDTVVRMINPTAQEIESLFRFKLVGFNNRRYDNHILYAASMGYSNEQIYKLSSKIINNDKNGLFRTAYSLSYADIYDFTSKKQGLKKYQIDLGLPHVEMDLPWDEPVNKEDIPRIVEYCVSDVTSTEVVFDSRKQDFVARQILSELSGLTLNDTTQNHTAKIIFGNERKPQDSFVYTDLRKEFPGYEFDLGKSLYRGEDPSEGGYVYSEPGIYENVAVLDIASMHPTTIEVLNMFGDFTPKFAALKEARIAIKRGDYALAKTLLGGKLEPYLGDEAEAQDLSYALKIVINIVYGLTSAKFENPFRDVRNVDNICAKRGALFMIDLKHYVQEALGLQVIHIKTDSIKVANASKKQIKDISDFGAKYGYDFEHENTFDKFCLVNKAVYVAREGDKWTAVGPEFQHPYIYKTLFTGEEITFDDLCETKQVTQGSMYLDFDGVNRPMYLAEGPEFVGRTGRFVPIVEGGGGGILLRVKDDKQYAVAGTKGYFWMEATQAKSLYKDDDGKIDINYFEHIASEAVNTINKFGDFEEFVK